MHLLRHHSSNSLFEVFAHSIVWTTARRFIYSLPLPFVIVAALFFGTGWLLRRFMPSRKR